MKSTLGLVARLGSKPATTSSLPHSQLSQHGPDEIIQKLHEWCFGLRNVGNEPSGISVPGSRALVLHNDVACNHEAFMVGREFAHIHPHPDNGSMHMMLSSDDATEVVAKGWGEDHYLVTQGRFRKGLVLVFSPRDNKELETVMSIVRRAYDFAAKVESSPT